jgi:acyl-CoA thioesterase-1
MTKNPGFGRMAALATAATTVVLALTSAFALAPAWAQTTAALPAPDLTAGSFPAGPKCWVSPDLARFEFPLARVAVRLATGRPLRIVAIGSSSTYGAGASTRANSYPSRLQMELGRHFPGHPITVINHGVNGDEAGDMLARFNSDVIDERPHLVLWQVGTNALLADRPLDRRATVLHEGLARLKSIRMDVALVDPQFAPKVMAKPNAERNVEQIAATAQEESVGVFRRYAMMKRWYEVDRLPFDSFVSPDGLHLNDWSYACLAKWIGFAIADAATRPATAVAGRPTR